ncbi:MAG: HelD family protein [Acidimicrobiales bacterium]
MSTRADLEAEQAHLDRAHARLEALRTANEAVLADALRGEAGGTHQARVEREAMVETTLRRLSALAIGPAPLCFGRIDTEDDEAFHIGRLAVADEDQTPLVVDWRAPVAEPFYRATGRHPLGLLRRRHFLIEGRRLEAIEDEHFALGTGDGNPDDAEALQGPGALLAALDRSRSGQMRDIVATVQREQDEVIRAPLPGVLVVQGGPGTGKTAVALHRAAYLLYTHRFPLERQGVLVVGPNRVFLRYIEQVLPSLGETGAELSTLAGLVGDIEPTASAPDPPETAALKGDARMAALVRRAVQDRQRALATDLSLVVDRHRLVLPAPATAEIVAAARRSAGTHNRRRSLVERLIGQRLLAILRRRDPEDGRSVPDLVRLLRRDPAGRAALERMWPVLSAEELLHDLFGSPALLALAGRRLLSVEERRLLSRPRAPAVGDVAWTAADLALLDEARVLLGPAPGRPTRVGRADTDEQGPRTYGHVVVDESQDLSPMELRLVGRRSLNGSMTLVGDLAQATGALAPTRWDDVVAHLRTERDVRIVELSVNYRTPAELMAMAEPVLAAALPGHRSPRSVRATGVVPVVRAVAGEEALVDAVARAVMVERDSSPGRSVAVIAAAPATEQMASALRSAGVTFGEAPARGLDQEVTLLPVELAKGLEFDVTVVVEPAELVARSAQGLRALYVALTRSTRRLVVVYARPLPEPLERAVALIDVDHEGDVNALRA